MAKFIQPSFAAGELSPSLAGRVDLAKYRVGLKTCKNFFVQPHGGVSNRPGTQYIAEAAGKGRLIPFRFNVVQTYVLEFTDFKMRVIKDGGLVQFGANTAVYGTDISDGSPTISPSLAFDGDEVTYWRTDHLGHDGIGLAYVGQDFTTAKTIGAIALLQGAGVPNVYSYNLLDAASSVLVQYSSNGSTWSTAATLDTSTVSNAASTEYSFTPVSARYWRIVQNSNVFSNYTGGAESYWKVRDLVFFQAGDLEVTSPYAEADLPLVKFVQSADTLFLTHPSYPPYKLTRTSHSSWEFTPMTFTVSSHTPLGLAAAYTNGDSSPVTVRTIKYQVSAIDSNGEESLPCAAVLVTDVDNPWFSGATVDISWTAVDGATGYNVYKNVRGYYGLIGTVRKDAARITTGSMISGGAGGGSTAAEAGDGLTLTHWVSSQVYTSVSGAAYIGRDLGSAKTVRAFRIMQGTRINNSYRNGLGSVATVTLQSSTNGSTWTTRQTVTLQTAPHIWQTIAVTGGISARYWRLLAGSQPTGTGTAQGWRVYELEFYEDGLGTNFTDDNIDPNPAFAPAEERNPFAGEGNQPGAVAIFEQRLVFARTDNAPQTIWTSRTGLFENMGQSAVALADDAIEVTIDSKQVNEIRHLVPFDELVVFTSGSEWIVSHGQNSDSLTPSSVSARIQGYRGCSDLSPLVIGRAMLFMQRNGGAVRELEFSLQVNGLNSTNISVLAQHLFKNHTLVEWAYQQEPDSIVWAVRDDGVLLGFSYLKEHEVWAWHQHVTDGEFESVCCIEGDGQDDLYMIVKRTIDGATVRFIERLAHRLPDDDVEDGVFLDAALTYNGRGTYAAGTEYAVGDVVYYSGATYICVLASTGNLPTNATYWTVVNASASSVAITSVTGLDHLEGEAVGVLADGGVVTGKTVSSGAITLSQAASKVHVGLKYTADIETLRIEYDDKGTAQGKHKKVSTLTLRLDKSRMPFVGPDADHLVELKGRSNEDVDVATGLTTGDIVQAIPPSWKSDGRIFIRQANPVPTTILSIIPEVDGGE